MNSTYNASTQSKSNTQNEDKVSSTSDDSLKQTARHEEDDENLRKDSTESQKCEGSSKVGNNKALKSKLKTSRAKGTCIYNKHVQHLTYLINVHHVAELRSATSCSYPTCTLFP